MTDLDRLLGDFRRIVQSEEVHAARHAMPGSPARNQAIADARTMRQVLSLLEVAGVNPSDETLERMARAHDQEDAAQRGEPTPWNTTDVAEEGDEEFRKDRLAAMRAAVEALAKP